MKRVWILLGLLAATAPGCGSDDANDSSTAEFLRSGGCSGATGHQQSSDYYITTFGCWTDQSGRAHGDSGDNCVPACLGQLQDLCGGRSGPACERHLNWYSADADRFGCGSLIRVTATHSGKSVVVAVIDRGPACWVENSARHAVLDLSEPASDYLFGGSQGAGDHARVTVEKVAAGTPLGPTGAMAPPSGPAEPGALPGVGEACNVGGTSGTCVDVAECGGVATPGHCPGPTQVQCCTW